jgi:hypothetical protein
MDLFQAMENWMKLFYPKMINPLKRILASQPISNNANSSGRACHFNHPMVQGAHLALLGKMGLVPSDISILAILAICPPSTPLAIALLCKVPSYKALLT